MKKLMIVAAVALVATAVQAATVNWASGTFTNTGLPSGTSCYGAATAYFYEITESQFTTWGDDMSKVYAAKADLGDSIANADIKANGKANVTTGGATAWTSGSSHWVAVIAEIVVGSGADAKTYYFANTLNASVGSGNNTTALSNYGAILHGGATGTAATWQTASVPEPTTGLMLLIGIGVMALKRKRA